MSILEKIGLSRKSRLFENAAGKPEIGTEPLVRRTRAKWITLVLFLVYLIAIFPRSSFLETSYKIGEPWRYDDLTAPFTFSLIKDREELEAERKTIRENTTPIYHIDSDASERIFKRIDSLFTVIMPVMDQYIQYRSAPSGSPQQNRDSLIYIQMIGQLKVGIDANGWSVLANDYYRFKNTKNGSNRPWVGTDLKTNLETIIIEILDDGLIDRKPSDLSNEIVIRNLRNRTERSVLMSLLYDKESAKEHLAVSLARNISSVLLPTAIGIFDNVSQANLIYNQDDTQSLLNEAFASMSPTASAVAAGQVIIRKGDIINRERMNMLQSLAFARAERASRFEVSQQYIGQILVIFAVVMVFFLYLYLYRRSIFDHTGKFFLVYLSQAILLGITAFIAHLDNVSPFLVPLAIAPILLTVIFDSRVGLMSTLTIAMIAGIMNGNDFEFVAASVVGCSIAVFSVRDVKSRSQFFVITPLLVFITYVIVITGFSMIRLGEWPALGNQIFFVFINAILIILTPPLILLFEKLFGVTTDLTLFELSETNSPLLKTLMMRAPGTFHHSLQVANLGEAAAIAIGANALLVRVGALYHDIGKMERPEYFVENQSGVNDHDRIKPQMSALVIKSHVGSGVSIAEEAKLPAVIIDFIKTHHGDSLIRYFYEKAREEAENPDTVSESEFKYEGPLPTTRETGILLLADSIEASARTLNDPSYIRLEQHIDRIVDERVHEGQLNECPLTFEDLRRIKKAFLTILLGVYHSRIKYPGQDRPTGEATDPSLLNVYPDSSAHQDRETAG
jgi:cyclic-di-AMP phosphodiesterase PgpH